MSNIIRILHLSDFHFRKDREDDFRDVLMGLGKTVGDIAKEDKAPNFVVLTGDLAHSGTKIDYTLVKKWIDGHLLKAIKNFKKENLLIIPGNHDVDRNKINAHGESLEEAIRSKGQERISKLLRTNSSLKSILSKQNQYIKFANTYRPSSRQLKVPWWHNIYKHSENLSIGFAGIATSLVAYGDDKKDYGQLVISDHQLEKIFRPLEKTNIRIALMHHPVAYLIGDERRSVYQYLLNKSSIVLRGHLHEQDSMTIKTPDHSILELATGSAYEDRKYDNTFQLIDIDTDNLKVNVQYWIWKWKGLEWIIDRNIYKNVKNGNSEFQIEIFNNHKCLAKKKVKKKKR